MFKLFFIILLLVLLIIGMLILESYFDSDSVRRRKIKKMQEDEHGLPHAIVSALLKNNKETAIEIIHNGKKHRIERAAIENPMTKEERIIYERKFKIKDIFKNNI